MIGETLNAELMIVLFSATLAQSVDFDGDQALPFDDLAAAAKLEVAPFSDLAMPIRAADRCMLTSVVMV